MTHVGQLKINWIIPMVACTLVVLAWLLYLSRPTKNIAEVPFPVKEEVLVNDDRICHRPVNSPSRSESLQNYNEATDNRTKYDMSFPWFASTCATDITLAKDVKDKSKQVVDITYNMCCKNSESACRTASKPLSVPLSVVQAIDASGSKAVDLAGLDLPTSLFFVTGASSNHFAESLVLLNSIQRFFPCSQTLYWDIGLNGQQAEQVKSMCGVTYKKFDFSKYPPHVSTLTTYAFKPLILMESLMEYRALWWVDSSVRFLSNNLDEVFKLIKQRHGLLMFVDPGHSVWSTTYPQMYEYVGTDAERLKDTVTAPGTSFIVVNTRELFSTILYWFYACASDVRCIAPISYPETCQYGGYSRVFVHCHRFDQSLLTILAANIWGFVSDGYRYDQKVFTIGRSSAGESGVKQCSDGQPLLSDHSQCVLRPAKPK